MKIIYATGRPSDMEFAVTSSENLIPKEATVYAVCDGKRTETKLDEQTFGAMTDGEYYRLQSLISAARESEAERARREGRGVGGLFGGFINRLFGQAA